MMVDSCYRIKDNSLNFFVVVVLFYLTVSHYVALANLELAVLIRLA